MLGQPLDELVTPHAHAARGERVGPLRDQRDPHGRRLGAQTTDPPAVSVSGAELSVPCVVKPAVRAPVTVTLPAAGDVSVTVLARRSNTASAPASFAAKGALRVVVYWPSAGQAGLSTGTA